MFSLLFFFFFNDTATTEIYTLSLHDALPIFQRVARRLIEPFDEMPLVLHGLHPGERALAGGRLDAAHARSDAALGDRKSTRLNSSHLVISYAVFCLKKKKHLQLWLLHRWAVL